MSIAPNVVLSPAHQAAFKKLQENTLAVQAFVQQVTTAGEKRNADLIQQGQSLWAEVAKEHGLDLSKVMYQPSPDGTELVAIQVRL